MNNIYVDELPKSCDGCCFNNDSYCVNNEYVIENYFTQTKHPNCPLKPLSDRLAEERKMVVQEIREKALLKQMNIDNDYDYEVGANDDWVICMEDLDAILREVSDE